MTLREQLFQELDNAPDDIVAQLLTTLRSFKANSQSGSIPGHPLANLSDEERLARINQVFGAWKDQPDLVEIFAEIDRDRHAYRGRQIDSMDD
jgi:hypothetical protein